MPRKRSPQRDQIVREAAFLRSQGLGETEIASLMAISQPYVNKLLAEAQQGPQPILRHRYELVGAGADDDQIVERHTIRSALQQAVDRFVNRCNALRDGGEELPRPKVQVFLAPWRKSAEPIDSEFRHAPAGDVDQEAYDAQETAWEDTAVVFARNAAPYCAQVLQDATQVGVGWGRTLLTLAWSLPPPAAPTRSSDRPPFFFPIWGSPTAAVAERRNSRYFPWLADINASSIARELNVWGRNPRPSLSLLLAPGRIPDSVKGSSLRTFHAQYLQGLADFSEIFGGAESKNLPLIASADSMLVSMGANDAWFLRVLFVRHAERLRRIQEAIYGDLGGALIWHDAPADPKQAASFCRLRDDEQERWTGVKEEHLRRCARNAALTNKPGVIVVAPGKVRSPVALEGIRRGLINHLVLDAELAKQLQADIEHELAANPS